MHPTTVTGFILILIVALLLFGPSKLPELGKAVGRTLREFKNGAKELVPDTDSLKREILLDHESQPVDTDKQSYQPR